MQAQRQQEEDGQMVEEDNGLVATSVDALQVCVSHGRKDPCGQSGLVGGLGTIRQCVACV